jgi:hypothetical protein
MNENEFIAMLVDLARQVPSGICKLPDGIGMYFTVCIDGDEIVFTDDLRQAVEEALGEKLVECQLPEYVETFLVPQSSVQ